MAEIDSTGSLETHAALLAGLNPEQAAAAAHSGGPLLIVAGAGTGKTRTLAHRVAVLLAGGADPERMLLLTFTRRSAQELLDRVTGLLRDRRTTHVWGGTFHAVANRLLRQFAEPLGLDPGFGVVDQSDAVELFRLVRSDHVAATARRFPKAETIASIYSRVADTQTPLGEVLQEDFPWCAEHGESIAEMFGAYRAEKRRQQLLDFADLLLFWRGLLATEAVGSVMRERFDHVLVDEYQDTNRVQADILKGMCPSGQGLCAVGDDAQAIYGFRAATVENLWSFPDHWPGTTQITLEQNYRSTEPVLAAANAVLAESEVHLPKTLWTSREGGRRPQLVTCHDEAAQSTFVCDQVLALREDGMDLREQAVLFRAGHHSDHLELELTRRGIPFVKYGGLKFLESAHVKDALACLRLLDNPADELAWHRILRLLEGVGAATATRLVEELAGPDGTHRFSVGEGELPKAALEAGAELRAALGDCLGGLDPDGGESPAMELDRFRVFLAMVFPAKYVDAEVRLGDIDQLVAAAGRHQRRSGFLTELILDPPDQTSAPAGPPVLDDDWLTLSTVHSAKGCEWRAVHLIHAADGNIPSDMALGDAEGMEEERRLLYVALTRARDALNVSFPLRYHVHRHGRDDRHILAQPSRFLVPVRDHFEECSVGPPGVLDPSALAERVGVADEVDTALDALWEI